MSRLLLTPFKKVRGGLVTSEAPWRSRTFVKHCSFTTSGIGSRASRYEEGLARGDSSGVTGNRAKHDQSCSPMQNPVSMHFAVFRTRKHCEALQSVDKEKERGGRGDHRHDDEKANAETAQPQTPNPQSLKGKNSVEELTCVSIKRYTGTA